MYSLNRWGLHQTFSSFDREKLPGQGPPPVPFSLPPPTPEMVEEKCTRTDRPLLVSGESLARLRGTGIHCDTALGEAASSCARQKPGEPAKRSRMCKELDACAFQANRQPSECHGANFGYEIFADVSSSSTFFLQHRRAFLQSDSEIVPAGLLQVRSPPRFLAR